MNNPIRKYRAIASATWALAVLCSFLWNQHDDIRVKNVIALETAQALLTHIMAVRTWNTEHGGVFVFADENTHVNTYLPEDQQALVTADGRKLVRLNPAHMIREISEIADRQGQVRFHLTSLKPIRPENKTTPWEEQWLKDFENGIAERSDIVGGPDEQTFRYMVPLRVTEACIPCHADYSLGEKRGGISVSLPLNFRKSHWPLLISHLAATIMGMLVIHFFASRLQARTDQLLIANQRLLKEVEEHKKSAQELVTIKEELELRVASRTGELSRTNALLDAKIKEQQQIERALVEINDEVFQIFNSAPDGMRIIGRDFTVIRANRAFLDLAGCKNGDAVIGRKCFEVFAGRCCHAPECPLTRILEGAERVEFEETKVRVDGSSFPCVVTATPFRSSSGSLIGAIENSRDITPWKNAERALSQAAHDLLLRNQELQDFSHVISHDLQEPLMLIQAFSQRLQNNSLATLSDKGKAYLERILSSADRMQLLINGLLYYTRVEKETLPFVPVQLNGIVRDVLEDLTIKREESGAAITVDDLGTVMADPLQMRQLFQNIIGNSLKYHHPDRAPEVQISRGSVPEGYDSATHVAISIKDNGIGFKEEYQEKIFDIFQRLHTRQQFKGTGIGLSICKKIVERHHGRITASAVPGLGSEFTVILPLSQGQGSPPAPDGAVGLIDFLP